MNSPATKGRKKGLEGARAPLIGSFPRAVPHQVSRPRVIGLLRDGESAALVLVTAPGGYGKTRILAEWANQTTRKVSWVTADASHRDPVVFVDSLVDSVTSACPEAASLSDLTGSGIGPSALLERLISAIAALEEPITTVIDDFHELEGSPVVELCSESLDLLPPNWNWVLSGRLTPSLGLGRRRTEMALAEFGVADLCLDDDEAERLLRALGLNANAATTRILNRRVKGWAVGLTLAGLLAAGSPEPERTMVEFRGRSHGLAQYLSEEIFDSLPVRLQDFLLRTSVLHSLEPDLCIRVSGESDTPDLLADISRRNLFVNHVAGRGDGHLVYHDLFGEWLRGEFTLRAPEAAAETRALASAWCVQRGRFSEAVEYAMEARDTNAAARLIEEHGYAFLQRGMFPTLLHWIGELPKATVRGSIELTALTADAALQAGSGNEVPQLAKSLINEDATTSKGRAANLAGLVLSWLFAVGSGSLNELSQLSDRIDELTARAPATDQPRHLGEDHQRALVLTALTRYLQGDVAGASTRLKNAARLPESGISQIVREGLESLLEIENQHDERAHHLAQSALSRTGSFDAPTMGTLPAAIAMLWVGDDRESLTARTIVERVIAGAGLPLGPVLHRLWDTEAAIRSGRQTHAREAIASARTEMNALPDPRLMKPFIERQSRRIGPAGMSHDGNLTRRERQILRLLNTGLTRSEIGRELGIASNTVKAHVSKLYKKLGVSSRSEAIRKAVELGI